jgi:hypothetical protein
MRTVNMFSVVLIAAIATGCASRSLTQNQCLAGDWQTVGHRDGESGHASTHLLKHQDACGKFGVLPVREQYLTGWQEGLRTYCRADRGFELGESGSGYNDVCPEEVRADFLSAYQHGHELHVARRDVHRLESRLARNQERLGRIDARVLELAAAQVDSELTAAQRADLFAQTKNLLEERKRIEHDIPALEFELGHAVARLDRIPNSR